MLKSRNVKPQLDNITKALLGCPLKSDMRCIFHSRVTFKAQLSAGCNQRTTLNVICQNDGYTLKFINLPGTSGRWLQCYWLPLGRNDM